jgi:membrane-bound lytic murein transglycosylase A
VLALLCALAGGAGWARQPAAAAEMPAPPDAAAEKAAPAVVPVAPDPPPLRPVPWQDLPGWREDAVVDALPALLESCRTLAAMPAARALGGAGEAARLGGTAGAWRDACAEAAAVWAGLPRLPPQAARAAGRRQRARARQVAEARNQRVRAFLERRFEPHAASATGLLTGYYEPILRGALEPDETYRVPLYARPPELAEVIVTPLSTGGGAPRRGYGQWREGRFELMPTRAEIEDGALAGRSLELVHVDDAVDAFFLHVQGSGRVVLPDGRLIRVGYAGQNGRPYRSIGRVLIERGEIAREAVSMQSIRDWLSAPGWEGWERAGLLMRENPSFIFFRRVEGLRPDQGPIGALGVPLTPMRSIAVDPAFVPLGAPVFMATRPADAQAGATPPVRRLVAAQDTGGAIRGNARGDLFFGWGREAGERAGRMRKPVAMFVLLPRREPVELVEQPAPRR